MLFEPLRVARVYEEGQPDKDFFSKCLLMVTGRVSASSAERTGTSDPFDPKSSHEEFLKDWQRSCGKFYMLFLLSKVMEIIIKYQKSCSGNQQLVGKMALDAL